MADAQSFDHTAVVEEKAVMDVSAAIQRVFKDALVHDGLKIGIREVVKTIESKEAKMCVMSEACSEDAYKQLITALCKEKGVPLFTVPNDSKELGQWAGLYKMDKEGNPRKIIGASSVAVVDFGEESAEKEFLLSQKPSE